MAPICGLAEQICRLRPWYLSRRTCVYRAGRACRGGARGALTTTTHVLLACTTNAQHHNASLCALAPWRLSVKIASIALDRAAAGKELPTATATSYHLAPAPPPSRTFATLAVKEIPWLSCSCGGSGGPALPYSHPRTKPRTSLSTTHQVGQQPTLLFDTSPATCKDSRASGGMACDVSNGYGSYWVRSY